MQRGSRAYLDAVELARRKSWQHIEAAQGPRLLERREALIERGEQGLLIEVEAQAEFQRGGHLLTEFRIRHPEHQRRFHAVAGKQRMLDFARIDVLAAGDDQLTCAPEDEQPEFGVELAAVAGIEKSFFVERCRVPEIAAEERRTPDLY